MGEILLFPSRRPEQQARARSASCGDPGLLICGQAATRIDCSITRRSPSELVLEGAIAAHDAAVLIDLPNGTAHYGRLKCGEEGVVGLSVVQSHDLEAAGAPQVLRRLWLDRVLIEGADSRGAGIELSRPAC